MRSHKNSDAPPALHRTLYTLLLLLAASTTPVSAQQAPTRTTLAWPQSLLVDALHGQIWVADFGNNRVLRFDVASLTGTAEQPRPQTAGAFALQQNFPNPFNPETRITFTLPNTEYATLTVFDLLGREVATLFAGTAIAHHPYAVTVSATNLPSGLYFYALRSASMYEVKTMSVLK